jgi:hypothetical protein
VPIGEGGRISEASMKALRLKPHFNSFTRADIVKPALIRRLQELGYQLQKGGTDPGRPDSYTTILLFAAPEQLVATVRLADDVTAAPSRQENDTGSRQGKSAHAPWITPGGDAHAHPRGAVTHPITAMAVCVKLFYSFLKAIYQIFLRQDLHNQDQLKVVYYLILCEEDLTLDRNILL